MTPIEPLNAVADGGAAGPTAPSADAESLAVDRAFIARTQVDELVRVAPARFVGTLTIAAIVAGTLCGEGFVPVRTGVLWACALVAGLVCQGFWIGQIKKRRTRMSDRAWTIGYCALLFFNGASWGWASVYFARGQPFEIWSLPGISMLGLVASATATLGVFLPAFLVFVATTMTPLLAADFFLVSPVGYVWFVLLSVFTAMVVYLGVDFNRKFKQRILGDLRLEQAAERQAQLRRVAEKAHADKARQLFEISHDLRQPIHALGLLVRAMQAESAGTRAEPLAKSVAASAASLQAFAIGLLDFSNLESGKVKVTESAVDLAELVERIFADERADATRSRIQLQFRRHPTTESTLIRCDAMLLERILRNLISNGVKYTRNGRVRVRVRATEAGRMQIDVLDTGFGIARENQAAIFDDFLRLDTNPGNIEGLGLGLAIVKRTADLIGAEIAVSSRPMLGSRFRVSIPHVRPLSKAPPIERQNVREPRRMSLLVVEDSPEVLAALKTVLAMDGHDIVTAQSADEALDKAKRGDWTPDVAVCDFRLGRGMDGLGLIEKLREQFGDALAAILVSGENEGELMERARLANATFLRKPFSVARLRALVEQATIAPNAVGGPAP